MKRAFVSAAVFPLVVTGCASPRDALPDIASIYKQAALNETRNPVVVIHGILGARLGNRESGQSIWGAFTDDYADPTTAAGSRAVALPLRIPGPATEYNPDEETIIATGPLETLKLSFLFNLISVDVYKNIIRTLGAGMYRDPLLVDTSSPTYAADHFTCYSFFYDWRRDNVTNAVQLGHFLRKARGEIVETATDKIARLRTEGGLENAHKADELQAWLDRGFRFDIVAHSLGGLIARYYLRYGEQDLPADGSEPKVTWAGAKEIDRLVMVGTPNLGSIDSLRQLTQGFQPSFVLPYYDQAILGSMPSIYQLLPRLRHGVVLDEQFERSNLDLFDPEVWDRNSWGVLDPATKKTLDNLLADVPRDQRRAKAVEYVAWCLRRAKEFHRAMDKKPESPSPAEIFLFAADSQRTIARTVIVKRGDRLVPTFPEVPQTMVYGDNVVSRYSALGDEREGGPYRFHVQTSIRFKNVTFLSDDHIGLTKNPHFSDNLLYILLEKPPPSRK